MSVLERFLAGVALIRKYQPQADIWAAQREEITFGMYATHEKMSEAEQEQMTEWGWHIATGDCWACDVDIS